MMNKDDMSEDYPHIKDILDAIAINQSEDNIVQLLDTFVNLLGVIGLSIEALNDDVGDFIDKQKLQKVINIAVDKVDKVMTDIILEDGDE